MILGQKKKMAYNDLEDHVVSWCVEQLSAIRDLVAEVEDSPVVDSAKKELIFRDYAKTIESLIDLISPLRHEERCLLEWAFNFVDEYFVFSDYDNE
jgi:hypothetical protein